MSDYPTIRPRLLLDFANSKKLDRRITFRRASTGTYVGVDGLIKTAGINEPRFDHDPVTGVCKGLLIEESRTNSATYSQQFDNAAWTLINSTVSSNLIVSPDGTLTADSLTETSANGSHSAGFTISSAPAGTYTLSVFAKAGRRSNIRITESSSTAGRANFNLKNGSFVSAGAISATMQPLPDNWFRCSVTITLGSVLNLSHTISLATDDSLGGLVQSYLGLNDYGVYLWGAQLEAGAFPTSYIPTTASTVTRSVDLALIAGTNFSSFYANTGSTILAYGESLGLSAGNECIVGAGTFGDGAQIRENNVQMMGMFRGTYGADANTSLLPPGLRKMCIAYAPSQISVFVLNGLIYFGGRAAAALSYPPLNILGIGSNGEGIAPWNGTVNRIAYWPKRLPDAQLQALTRR